VRSSSRLSGSKNCSVCPSIRMLTRRPPRISAANSWRAPSDTMPLRATVRSTSNAAPSPGGGSGGGPAGRPPSEASATRSLTDRCERIVLTRAPPMSSWMTSVSAQNVTVNPGPGRPEAELLTGHAEVPRRRNHPVELHRATHRLRGCDPHRQFVGGGTGRCCAGLVIRLRGDMQRRGKPRLNQRPLLVGHGCEPVVRGHRQLVVQRLVRPKRWPPHLALTGQAGAARFAGTAYGGHRSRDDEARTRDPCPTAPSAPVHLVP
jgi:hypothetical protein